MRIRLWCGERTLSKGLGSPNRPALSRHTPIRSGLVPIYTINIYHQMINVMMSDKSSSGEPYEFQGAHQLLSDFFFEVDRVLGGDERHMKTIVVGILPQERIRERLLAIARGDYKPKANEPKVWFTSMRSLAEVLSDENRALLQVIRDSKPKSITTLADLTGRKTSNLSRTLKTMAKYGFVEMRREGRQVCPVAKAIEFRIVV